MFENFYNKMLRKSSSVFQERRKMGLAWGYTWTSLSEPCWSSSPIDLTYTDLHFRFLCILVASWPYQQASAFGPQVSLHFHSVLCLYRTSGTGSRVRGKTLFSKVNGKKLKTKTTVTKKKIFVIYPWRPGTYSAYNFLWIIISMILSDFYLYLHNSAW